MGQKNMQNNMIDGQLELTWPDCPTCGNRSESGACDYKEVCYIETCEEGYRVGDPTCYKAKD